jgi:hypothetical protein
MEEIEVVSGGFTVYDAGYYFGRGVRAVVDFLTVPAGAEGDAAWVGAS